MKTLECPNCRSERIRIVFNDDMGTEVDFYDCTICSHIFYPLGPIRSSRSTLLLRGYNLLLAKRQPRDLTVYELDVMGIAVTDLTTRLLDLNERLEISRSSSPVSVVDDT